MSEYSGKIVLGVVLAVIVGSSFLVGLYYLPQGNRTSTSSLVGLTSSFSFVSVGGSPPTNSSLEGIIPYLVVNSQNHSFVLSYTITAYNYTLSLSYDQSYSYAVLYSNNTGWLSTSRPCPNQTITSIGSSLNSFDTSATIAIVTQQQIPCGRPDGEWYTVNGTVLQPSLSINSSNVQMTIQPATIPPHTTEQVNVFLSIEMKPGVYAINLSMDIQTPGSRPLHYLLGYTPLIVQA